VKIATATSSRSPAAACFPASAGRRRSSGRRRLGRHNRARDYRLSALRAVRLSGRARAMSGRAQDAHRCCRFAGIGIALDLDDVAATGKRLRQRHMLMRRVEPGRHARRQPDRTPPSPPRKHRCADRCRPPRQSHVPCRDFRKMRCELTASSWPQPLNRESAFICKMCAWSCAPGFLAAPPFPERMY
jgi:hypothetical protein